MVSVAAADTTTTDYPDDKVPLPLATAGQPVLDQRPSRAATGFVLSEARPGILAEGGVGGDSRRS